MFIETFKTIIDNRKISRTEISKRANLNPTFITTVIHKSLSPEPPNFVKILLAIPDLTLDEFYQLTLEYFATSPTKRPDTENLILNEPNLVEYIFYPLEPAKPLRYWDALFDTIPEILEQLKIIYKDNLHKVIKPVIKQETLFSNSHTLLSIAQDLFGRESTEGYITPNLYKLCLTARERKMKIPITFDFERGQLIFEILYNDALKEILQTEDVYINQLLTRINTRLKEIKHTHPHKHTHYKMILEHIAKLIESE